MRLTVQQGIDAHDLSQAIYRTILEGLECDARLARLKHAARMDLLKKQGIEPSKPAANEQQSLF